MINTIENIGTNPDTSNTRTKELCLRFQVFLDICYNGNINALAIKMGTEPSTLHRWLKGAVPKLSKLFSLEENGCSLFWLINGYGSMFSNNEIGENFRTDEKVKLKFIKHPFIADNLTILSQKHEHTDKISGFQFHLDLESSGEQKKQSELDIFLSLNKSFHGLYVDLYCFILEENYKSEIQKLNLLGKSDEIGSVEFMHKSLIKSIYQNISNAIFGFNF